MHGCLIVGARGHREEEKLFACSITLSSISHMSSTVLDAEDPEDITRWAYGNVSNQENESRGQRGVHRSLAESGGLWNIQMKILIINWTIFQNPHLPTMQKPD